MTGWVQVGDSGALVRSRWIYNCYVLPDPAGSGPLVVDVGLPSHGRAVASWLRHSGHDLTDGRVTVAATHLHVDHVGGLPELGAAWGEPTDTLLPDRGKSYAAGEEPRTPGPRAVAHILPVMRSQRFSFGALAEAARSPKVGFGLSPFAVPVPEPTWVADGDPVGPGGEWVAMVAPGHTDDSTVYYHAASRTMASGDAVLTVGGRGWFNPEYVDAERSAETEDRLRSVRVDVLLPGHGRPLTGRDLLAHALGHRDRPRRRRR